MENEKIIRNRVLREQRHLPLVLALTYRLRDVFAAANGKSKFYCWLFFFWWIIRRVEICFFLFFVCSQSAAWTDLTAIQLLANEKQNGSKHKFSRKIKWQFY